MLVGPVLVLGFIRPCISFFFFCLCLKTYYKMQERSGLISLVIAAEASLDLLSSVDRNKVYDFSWYQKYGSFEFRINFQPTDFLNKCLLFKDIEF